MFRVFFEFHTEKADLAKALFFFKKTNKKQAKQQTMFALSTTKLSSSARPTIERRRRRSLVVTNVTKVSQPLFFFCTRSRARTKVLLNSVLRDLFSLLSRVRYFFQLLMEKARSVLTSLYLSISFENEQTTVDAGRTRLRKSSHG